MFTTQDERFMRQAIDLAKHAEKQSEVPVGAILVLNNDVIGRGWNCPISRKDPTSHAEIMALKEAALSQQNYRLPDTTLYVTLEPCLMCVGAMIHARIKRLVFGARDERFGVVVSVLRVLDEPIFNHQVQYEFGLLDFECGQLLKSFFQKKRFILVE